MKSPDSFVFATTWVCEATAIIGIAVLLGGCSHVTRAADVCTDSDTCDTNRVEAGTTSEADTALMGDTVFEPESTVPEPEPVFHVDTATSECVDGYWNVTMRPVNLLILLDRSASMGKYPEDAKEKYANTVQQAIETTVARYVGTGQVNFALNVFPSAVECDADYGQLTPSQQSPEIGCQPASQFVNSQFAYTEPLVPFATDITRDTYSEIHNALSKVGTCGGTPMAKSLQWAKVYLDSAALKDDTYVILATDGAPGCNFEMTLPCSSVTVGNEAVAPEMCLDDQSAIEAVSELKNAGFETFVLGVGQSVASFEDVMNAMAYRGRHTLAVSDDYNDIPARPHGDLWYFRADDADSVNSGLDAITQMTADCTFTVDWTSIPEKSGVNQPMAETCAQTRMFGIPATGGENVSLPLMRSCDLEDADSADAKLHVGWTWVELEGMYWSEIESLTGEASKCTGVRLCPNACSKLKKTNGSREWEGLSAVFGCQPQLVVE